MYGVSLGMSLCSVAEGSLFVLVYRFFRGNCRSSLRYFLNDAKSDISIQVSFDFFFPVLWDWYWSVNGMWVCLL